MRFVQNSQAVTLEDGVLTLEGVRPTTVFFSDRPERMAGHGLTSQLVTFWTTGGCSDNFKKDPPNATLSIVTEETADDIVVTLTNPRLTGDTLRYEVTIIDGRDQAAGCMVGESAEAWHGSRSNVPCTLHRGKSKTRT